MIDLLHHSLLLNLLFPYILFFSSFLDFIHQFFKKSIQMKFTSLIFFFLKKNLLILYIMIITS
ncbi:hypothetical protein DFH28DRAFT_966793 [Melampsora americana]|nr:hypothetical protein DFH28DRAFT_966793 [Melampsora americana]